VKGGVEERASYVEEVAADAAESRDSTSASSRGPVRDRLEDLGEEFRRNAL